MSQSIKQPEFTLAHFMTSRMAHEVSEPGRKSEITHSITMFNIHISDPGSGGFRKCWPGRHSGSLL